MYIPLVDLKSQYKSLKKEIMQVTREIFEQQNFILGSQLIEFENKIASYCGSSYAVGVSSGTDALMLSLMAYGIGPGDFVISTPYTFFATIGSIVRVGATPLFVDINANTYNMCPKQLETFIDSLTNKQLCAVKAIIPVHLYGQCADMSPILKIANDNNIKVIEDSAQAMGAEYKSARAGSFGNCSCFSFFPSKVLGGFGDGGAITTNSSHLAKLLKVMRNHGAEKRYHHRIVGGNFRLDTLQAAIISIKIKYLDKWINARNKNAIQYIQLFKDANLTNQVRMPINVSDRHVYSQFVINVTNRRDELKKYLAKKNIASEIYYPIPLHLQECFTYLKYKNGMFPESEYASKHTLSIPIYPELTYSQQTFIVETIKSFFNSTCKE